MALGMPPISLNTASNITHSAITSEDSSQVRTTFSAHYTAHCAARDFNVRFCESRCKVGKIPYRTVRMISRERVSCPGTAIGRVISGPQWVQCKDYVHVEIYRTGICEVEITRTSFLLEEEMAFSQTGGTLAFMINTFGPSAGCVSRSQEVHNEQASIDR